MPQTLNNKLNQQKIFVLFETLLANQPEYDR